MALQYPYKNFYEMALANAASFPNKTVVFIDNQKVTNKELLEKIDSFARFLELCGLEENEKTALVLPNSLEFLVAVFAIGKLGGVVVPVNNMLKRDEISYILNDCEAKIVITSIEYAKEIKDIGHYIHHISGKYY